MGLNLVKGKNAYCAASALSAVFGIETGAAEDELRNDRGELGAVKGVYRHEMDDTCRRLAAERDMDVVYEGYGNWADADWSMGRSRAVVSAWRDYQAAVKYGLRAEVVRCANVYLPMVREHRLTVEASRKIEPTLSRFFETMPLNTVAIVNAGRHYLAARRARHSIRVVDSGAWFDRIPGKWNGTKGRSRVHCAWTVLPRMGAAA